jgi:hypothetical protein
MPSRHLAVTAAALAVALSSGCVSNIYYVDADPSPEGTTADPPAPPPADESTTRAEDESSSSTSSTGAEVDSTGEASTSTGEEIATTGGEASTSTGSIGDSSSTGEPVVPQGQGAECWGDEECAAPGWCSSDVFDDNAVYRCTRECNPLDAGDACDIGACIDSGDKWRCSGSWLVKSYTAADVFVDGATLLYDASGIDLPAAGGGVAVYFIPAQPLAYSIGVDAIGPDQVWGPARVDAYTSTGASIGHAVEGAPLVIDQTNQPLILIVQAMTDKKSWAHMYLKNL